LDLVQKDCNATVLLFTQNHLQNVSCKLLPLISPTKLMYLLDDAGHLRAYKPCAIFV
jgi:hypothetical protein